jgi:hypothetical protein
MRLTASLLIGALTVTAAAPRAAQATPYEAFVDVETEEDLYDLVAAGQISAETFEILRTLLARGVDLDTASREEIYSLPNLTYDEVDGIIAYRTTQGYVGDPANLVAAGTLSADKLYSISAFLIVTSRERDPNRPRGWVRGFSRVASADDRAPPVGLQARMMVGRRVTAGLAASLTRKRIGEPTWDPNRGGLIADDAEVRPHLPKLYVRYKGDHFDAIAGSYKIGFGQRLTFDTSSDYTPDGIYVDDQLSGRSDDLGRRCQRSTGELTSAPCTDDLRYISPDYGWSQGLQGVAAGSDHIPAGTGYITAHIFGSYAARSIYQYELEDRAACADPRNCGAPPVYVRPDGDPLTPTPEHAYKTLPDAYAEALVGGNITFHARRRDFLGVTAYGAVNHWLIDTPDQVQLDTQEWSRVPIGGRYGAAGVNVGIGRGIFDLFAEATYSFDRIPKGAEPIDGGGGPAVIVRATRTQRRRELELSLRYYDPDFVNPYGGAIAAADEVEGQRVRGEHGVRGKYTGTHGALTVRAQLDLWRALAETGAGYEYVPKLDVDGRVDVAASEKLRYGLGLQLQDRDLGPAEGDECYEVKFDDGPTGAPIACSGKKVAALGRVRWVPDRRTTIAAQLSLAFLDERSTATRTRDGMRQDRAAVLTAAWRPRPDLRLNARVRYRDEDVAFADSLETSLATYLEASLRLRKKDQLRLRADAVFWLDDRDNTAKREPSPELWLAAFYQLAY